jgi:hypothetical protein
MKYVLSFLLLTACTVNKPIEPISCPEPVERVRTVYVQTPLPLPIKPQIPVIKGKDMRCLTPTTQWELKNRDTILKDYISELETIIKSTRD